MAAIAISTIASLPVFLVGALAVEMRQSLRLGTSQLGLAVTLYYLGAAAAGIPAGLLTERLGAARVMRAAAGLSAVLLLLVATVVGSWGTLVTVLLLAGVLSSTSNPATNLFLARRMPKASQGLAFGVKQAAVPLGTLLAGLALPGIALTVGWRWAFGVAAALALLSSALVPPPRTTLKVRRAHRGATGSMSTLRLPLFVLVLGFTLGVLTTTVLSTFVVSSGVAAGLPKGTAGLVAALAGLSAIAARIFIGWKADSHGGRQLPVVATMLALGAVGYLALAGGSATRDEWLFISGAMLAFGVGWGWNGLFNLVVVQSYPQTPAFATSVTQAVSRAGAMTGPLVFGIVTVHVSYSFGWLLLAASALGAGLVMLLAQRLLEMVTSSDGSDVPSIDGSVAERKPD